LEIDKFIESFLKGEYFKPEISKVEIRWSWQNVFAEGFSKFLAETKDAGK
jgi:hypothetical protein